MRKYLAILLTLTIVFSTTPFTNAYADEVASEDTLEIQKDVITESEVSTQKTLNAEMEIGHHSEDGFLEEVISNDEHSNNTDNIDTTDNADEENALKGENRSDQLEDKTDSADSQKIETDVTLESDNKSDTYGDWQYTSNDDGTLTITRYTGSYDNDIIIPSVLTY